MNRVACTIFGCGGFRFERQRCFSWWRRGGGGGALARMFQVGCTEHGFQEMISNKISGLGPVFVFAGFG